MPLKFRFLCFVAFRLSCFNVLRLLRHAIFRLSIAQRIGQCDGRCWRNRPGRFEADQCVRFSIISRGDSFPALEGITALFLLDLKWIEKPDTERGEIGQEIQPSFDLLGAYRRVVTWRRRALPRSGTSMSVRAE